METALMPNNYDVNLDNGVMIFRVFNLQEESTVIFISKLLLLSYFGQELNPHALTRKLLNIMT